jgi:hypothetical protein
MKCSIWAGLVVTALFLGCSDEREPVPPGAPADAATDAGTSIDVAVDVSAPDRSGPDGYINLFDIFPLPDGGCPGCIRDRCGSQINACFNNPACAAGLFCTLQMCAGGLLGDSGLSPSSLVCVLGCFGGDQSLAFLAIGSFTCVTMTCGGACNFLDAGSDARPPNPDVEPDASADAPPSEDASMDTTAPDAEPDGDADSDDGDSTTPDGDPPFDASGDVTPETGDQPDIAPPTDAIPDVTPPDEGGAD